MFVECLKRSGPAPQKCLSSSPIFTVVIGKGYADVEGDPWDVHGADADQTNPKVIAWDATRVIVGSTVDEASPDITGFAVVDGTAAIS